MASCDFIKWGPEFPPYTCWVLQEQRQPGVWEWTSLRFNSNSLIYYLCDLGRWLNCFLIDKMEFPIFTARVVWKSNELKDMKFYPGSAHPRPSTVGAVLIPHEAWAGRLFLGSCLQAQAGYLMISVSVFTGTTSSDSALPMSPSFRYICFSSLPFL